MGAEGSSFEHRNCYCLGAQCFLNEGQCKIGSTFGQSQNRFSSDYIVIVLRSVEQRIPNGRCIDIFLRKKESGPVAI